MAWFIFVIERKKIKHLAKLNKLRLFRTSATLLKKISFLRLNVPPFFGDNSPSLQREYAKKRGSKAKHSDLEVKATWSRIQKEFISFLRPLLR